jgi:hypothetical protein
MYLLHEAYGSTTFTISAKAGGFLSCMCISRFNYRPLLPMVWSTLGVTSTAENRPVKPPPDRDSKIRYCCNYARFAVNGRRDRLIGGNQPVKPPPDVDNKIRY